jgi:hypothetical protein
MPLTEQQYREKGTATISFLELKFNEDALDELQVEYEFEEPSDEYIATWNEEEQVWTIDGEYLVGEDTYLEAATLKELATDLSNHLGGDSVVAEVGDYQIT